MAAASMEPPSYTPPMPPKTAKITIVIRPATAEYLIRLETTPPMSAGFPFLNCWVDADAMVVSEIGARLSPKIAPDTIQPAIIISFAPSIMPAG